jgi:predicted Zn-dependent peptidase
MVEKSILDNGIRVVTEKIVGVHSVSVGVWVENGSRHEEAAQGGVSHFVEHMLFKGTQSRCALDIARAIDSVGGVLNAFTGREYTCYHAKVLARKLPLAIDLLGDILLNSVFDIDEIEKERRVILQEISMLQDTPEDLVHDLFNQGYWQGHPLGRSVVGTAETVGRISREELLAFLSARYCGANLLITAAGELDHAHLVELVTAAFATLPAGNRLPLSPLPEYHRRFNLEERDLEQVHICLGCRALPQNHPNRFASYLLNSILGGSMSSRLFQRLREDLGLVYSIYSYLNCHSDAGALVVYAATAPDDAPQAVDIILRELHRLRSEPVEREELQAACDQLKGQLLLSLESTDNRMTRLAKNEIYLGRNPSLKEVLAGFDRVTVEDLQRLAEFTLRDDYLALQLLGRCDGTGFSPLDLTLG